MPTGLRVAVRTLVTLAMFFLVVVVLFYGGQILYSLPGNLAKSLSYTLVGTEQGPIATLFFLVFAALYVGAIGSVVLIALRVGARGPGVRG